MNDYLRFKEVMVINKDKKNIGKMKLENALDLAYATNDDLFCIAPHALPPVCQVGDYSKWKFNQNKSVRKYNKAQKIKKVKQIRFKAFIGENDLEIKINKTKEFLKQGFKVKLSMVLYGRQMANKVELIGTMNKFLEKINDSGKPMTKVIQHGKFFDVVITPNK